MKKIIALAKSNVFLSVLLVLGSILRISFLFLPHFSEVQYEEAAFGLQAMHVLQGSFSVFIWGQAYLGSLEPTVTALLFYLFGVSTFVLRLVPCFISMAYLIVMVVIAYKLWGKRIAQGVAIFVSLPPLYLSIYFALAYQAYLGVVVLTALVLYWLCKIIIQKADSGFNLFLAGVFLGTAFWQHPMSIPVLVCAFCCCFLMLRRLFLEKGIIYLAGGCFLGGLPLWLWNIFNDFKTFRYIFLNSQSLSTPAVWNKLNYLFRGALPFLLGNMDTFRVLKPAHNIFKIIFFVLYIPFCCFLVTAVLKSIKRVISTKQFWPRDIFMLFTAIVLAVFMRTSRTDVRYLLPLFGALPFLWALFIDFLREKSKFLGMFFVGGIVLLHGQDNVQFLLYNHKIKESDIRQAHKVIEFLKERNLKKAYAHYTTSRVITFESAGEITCADHHGFYVHGGFSEQSGNLSVCRDYLREVDNAVKAAIITNRSLTYPHPDDFERDMKTIAGSYEKKELGDYVIFYNFSPPYKSLRSLNPLSFKALASHNQEIASHAFDRNHDTRWHSRQKKGVYFSLDLGQVYEIAKVTFNLGKYLTDSPNSYMIEISLDGKQWQEVKSNSQRGEYISGVAGFDWFGLNPRYSLHGNVHLYFKKPLKFRFIRFTLAGENKVYDWTIDEIFLYEEDKEDYFLVSLSVMEKVYEYLKETKVDFVYLEPYLSSRYKSLKRHDIPFFDIYEMQHILRQQRVVDCRKKNAFVISTMLKDEFEYLLNSLFLSYNKQSMEEGVLVYTLERFSLPFYLFWSSEGILKTKVQYITPVLYSKGLQKLKKGDLNEAKECFSAIVGDENKFYQPAYAKLLEIFKSLGDTQPSARLATRFSEFIKIRDSRLLKTEEGINLLAYSLSSLDLSPGAIFSITYFWTTAKRLKKDYAVFVHFSDEEGNILFQNDHLPLDGNHMFSRWIPQEIIKETYNLKMPEDIKTDKVYIWVGVWDPEETKQRLVVTGQASSLAVSDNKVCVGKIVLQ